MKQKLIEILEKTGFEVYEQGSFTRTEEYPDNFFTYWNDATEDIEHYDNKESACAWYFTIDFYATNPLVADAMIEEAKKRLVNNGWIVDGKGRDIYSDSKKHSGRRIETVFEEKEKNEHV